MAAKGRDITYTLGFPLLLAAVMFGAAGRLDIPPFWIYIALLASACVAATVFLDEDLLKERRRPGGKSPPGRLKLLTLLVFAHWLSAGLDARYHWLPPFPARLQYAGLMVFGIGIWLFYWAMHTNRFFSSIIRIQQDRGQYVITSGPYAGIRHPGYLAALLIIIGSGLGLGSKVAALLVAFTIPMTFWRAAAEDKILHAQLPGYTDYARRVRYRILPGIW